MALSYDFFQSSPGCSISELRFSPFSFLSHVELSAEFAKTVPSSYFFLFVHSFRLYFPVKRVPTVAGRVAFFLLTYYQRLYFSRTLPIFPPFFSYSSLHYAPDAQAVWL